MHPDVFKKGCLFGKGQPFLIPIPYILQLHSRLGLHKSSVELKQGGNKQGQHPLFPACKHQTRGKDHQEGGPHIEPM